MAPRTPDPRPTPGGPWRAWIDTGGTFTDCVAIDPEGRVHRAKVLSSARLRGRVSRITDGAAEVPNFSSLPAGFLVGQALTLLGGPATGGPGLDWPVGRVKESNGARLVLEGPASEHLRAGSLLEIDPGVGAPILACHVATATPLSGSLPELRMRLGTTRATNALLERTIAPVALFITRGFANLPLIGDQTRPDLFALDIRRPDPLHARVIEVDERIAPDGSIARPMDLESMIGAGRRCLEDGVRSAAVSLLHSWCNPAHERELGARLAALGFSHVSCSCDLSPTIRILPRMQTAIANAALAPVIDGYLDRVEDALGRADTRRLHVMTSSGSLVARASVRPKNMLLSGPAGGVVGAIGAARDAGIARAIALDMGGTSTDVTRCDDTRSANLDLRFEHAVGEVRILAPALAIESVAAGGGSICWIDRGELRVGPRSAGAEPGPACYGSGGPLTITDCNVLLGRVRPDGFVFQLDAGAAEARAAALRREFESHSGRAIGLDALLQGFLDLANERMAGAIRCVSVRRGYDPSEYTLVVFGGAGPQHACALAELLGIGSVLVPQDASLLSARGMGEARFERFAERQVLRPLRDVRPELPAIIRELAVVAEEELRGEGAESTDAPASRVFLRFTGQESSIEMAPDPLESLEARFVERHHTIYGHAPAGRPVEVESIRVGVGETREARECAPTPACENDPEESQGSGVRAVDWTKAPLVQRDDLRPGHVVSGPVLVRESHSTTVVEPEWTCALHESGGLMLRRAGAGPGPARTRPEEIETDLLAGRLEGAAGEMGELLRRTALSVNVKERMDFSCAVLNQKGELIASAPHVPVHLGSLGVCVRRVCEAMTLGPGDVVVTNHPGLGGSHLPDVTVIAPVHDRSGALVGYVANRAHHAEIGGIRPGSMPPGARRLSEEGVVIPPTLLVRAGVHDAGAIERLLRAGPHPSRSPCENLADLDAQLAAAVHGRDALERMAAETGADTLARRMERINARAASRMSDALARLGTRTLDAVERLDDGSPIRAEVRVENGQATIDFSGSAPVHAGNLNATEAIGCSAVLYVLRALVAEPLPFCEGLMRPVRLIVPPGMLNPPFDEFAPGDEPAVAAGNTETSQRLVDTLLKALGLAACSQGTMNNVLFGNADFAYYETVCGGAGAGPGFDGASAVHTHMTNTRITDPEVLEHRYPVRLLRFQIRRDSGGDGRFKGGNGVVREIEFRSPVSLSIISQHRAERPYGLEGGLPGATGTQRIVRADGRTEILRGCDAAECAAGDRFILETPGGGGFGPPVAERARQ